MIVIGYLRKIFFLAFFLILIFSFSNANAATFIATANTKGVTDDTGDALSDIIINNGLTVAESGMVSGDGQYTTIKNAVMYIDSFDITGFPAGATITDVELQLNYGTQGGYATGPSVQYAKQGDALQSTGIQPITTSGAFSSMVTANLFSLGVTNSSQIQTLDIEFTCATNKTLNFDYLWIAITYMAAAPPATPTIDPVSSPTNNTTQTVTGEKSADTTTINIIALTASVGPVSYPTGTTWEVTLTSLNEGDNIISANAENI
ncbi:hypothetical protein ACFL5G_05780, partial [Candidatus Margulisiibacteriota bacterium]